MPDEKAPGDKPLTDRELRFVQAYARSGIKAQAVREAGYSAKGTQVQAAKLLAKPRIIEALIHEREELARLSNLTTEAIIEGLRREAITADSAQARVKAWELLGKTRSLFTDKVELSGTLTQEQRKAKILAIVQAGLERAKAAPAEAPPGAEGAPK